MATKILYPNFRAMRIRAFLYCNLSCTIYSHFSLHSPPTQQVIATKTMAHPLRELKRLIRMRVAETRDVAGFNLAALKVIAKLANERTTSRSITTAQTTDIWAGLGLGSDVAAALEGRSKRR